MKPTREQIRKLFERGTVADVIPSKDALSEHLLRGKPFHIYLGLDPTAERVHLGHIQNILFLEDLRRIGAKVTLLFGSFTALFGDPSGKNAARPLLTLKDIHRNMRGWKKQITPVLNLSWFGGARIRRNSAWFDRFSMEDFLKLMRETTVQQLLERDMFQKRMKEGKPLHTHEMLYPILQGYDSVAMRVDAELCGTDQTFNALIGRTMVRRYLNREKYVITMNLIQGDGIMMSKSAGTGVFVDREQGGNNRMFGSVMALPDSFIEPLFRGCTRVPLEEIATLDLRGGVPVRDAKLRLAKEIVSLFWGESWARRAEEEYIAQFREKETPESAPVIRMQNTSLLAIVAEHAAESRADAKRKFAQGAVSLDGKKITDIGHAVEKGKTYALRVGRKIFVLE